MKKENQVDHQKVSNDDDGSPKFGRLLIILLLAVAFIVAITFATEAYHTP
jgi:hypothetical protein